MSIAGRIREYLRERPAEALLTRGELLAFGHRIAVDNAIYHLVNKTGEMVRVARGLFVKRERTSPVTVLEAATAKCKRFGKQIITAPEQLVHDLGLSSESPLEPIFSTNGRTSAFMFQGRRIIAKGTSPRKMALGDSFPGRIIRALCHLGRGAVDEDIVGRATRNLDSHERTSLANLCSSMPGWLADFFFSWTGLETARNSREWLEGRSYRKDNSAVPESYLSPTSFITDA